jgi:CBS domain-containing protein
MATRYSDYERGSYGRHYADEEDRGYESRERGYGGRGREDRDLIARATDEVRSWFGDEEAGRRRHHDEWRGARGARHDSYGDPRFGREVRARDVMTLAPATVYQSDPVERAARYMREYDCGAIPVVDDEGCLVGMVTDRDITVRLVARGIDVRRAFVDDCMTDEAFACHVNDPIESCMRAMSRHQVRRLPIIDDRGRVLGIVSQGDLARHAGRHTGRGERRAMADVVCAVSEPTNAPYRYADQRKGSVMSQYKPMRAQSRDVRIPAGAAMLEGVPAGATGLLLFAHGSGSSRHSPRNQYVARVIRESGVATLLFDLLTRNEEAIDLATRHLRFDIDLLAERLVGVTIWAQDQGDTRGLRAGYFGASTGASAALLAAAAAGENIGAVVSRGGQTLRARHCRWCSRRRCSSWAGATR